MRSATASPAVPAEPSRRAAAQFFLIFILLVGLYYAFSVTSLFGLLLDPYLRLNAWLTAGFLRLFESGISQSNNIVSSPRFALQISRGCDAIDPCALFAAAVLAFPVPPASKLPGLLLGCAALMILNLVRIISLYYVGVHAPRFFDLMHHDVWQGLFIFLAFAFWMLWANGSMKSLPAAQSSTDVSS